MIIMLMYLSKNNLQMNNVNGGAVLPQSTTDKLEIRIDHN